MNTLNALVLSLPTHNSTIRMRVWRALKDTGCGVLRDGVYVLPQDVPGAAVLPRMESDIRAAGGVPVAGGTKVKRGGAGAPGGGVFLPGGGVWGAAAKD